MCKLALLLWIALFKCVGLPSPLPTLQETGFFCGWGGSWDTPYGRFFLEWYSRALVDHGERLLRAAGGIFKFRTSTLPRRRRGQALPNGNGSGGPHPSTASSLASMQQVGPISPPSVTCPVLQGVAVLIKATVCQIPFLKAGNGWEDYLICQPELIATGNGCSLLMFSIAIQIKRMMSSPHCPSIASALQSPPLHQSNPASGHV